MRKDKNLEYVQKLRSGGVENKAMNYINDLRLVKPSAPSGEIISDYLCFTATGESTIGLTNNNENAPVLFYSTDKENWVSWDYSTITIKDRESVYFYGENPDGFSKSSSVYSTFTMTGSIAAGGNIQTLLSQEGEREDVTANCYYKMFENCTSLTTAPKLPATTLASGCYNSMFKGCTLLTTAPKLPATTLAGQCYESMFEGCTSLTVAPELPATTLTSSCYWRMFTNCTSLTVAPVLPATTLAASCYSYMFNGCTSLQSVTTYVKTWNAMFANFWLKDAGTSATNPTLYCPAASTIPSDNNSGIPTGWTRADLQ